ncbi:MAG TPA: hypothetical protein VJ843_05720 [Candidatus Saccharimonadales bacterium]|nr:hypothetical protein [Candidatus Saccharimonadales bacterium]
MMFGHDDHHNDQHENNQGAPAPVADDTLGAPAVVDGNAPAMNSDDSAGDFIMDDAPQPPKDLPPVPPAPPAGPADNTVVPAPKPESADDLLRIKQEALSELAPMVDHLDQKPEEKFRTTMMMIQATDNDKLIPAAYAAAKEIADDKVRAQAYLDIVNEINYFTQTADADKVA